MTKPKMSLEALTLAQLWMMTQATEDKLSEAGVHEGNSNVTVFPMHHELAWLLATVAVE